MALKEVKLKGTPIRRALNRRKQLERDLEHVTHEMYRRNKELADTNRTLSLLRTIDSLVLESHDAIDVLCVQISMAIAKSTEYPFVALLGQPSPTSEKLQLYGWSAGAALPVKADLLTGISPGLHHAWFHSKEKTSFISLAGVTPKDLVTYLGCDQKMAEELVAKLPLKSLYLAKLYSRQKLVGVMVVGSLESASGFKEGNTLLLERLGEAIGIALDNKLLFEENQLVLHQLQKTNAKLRALDKAKDEFISMASHQLRTPLTAVKGYLSMVLEGDVGPVTAAEKDMVKRAFDGAQKMVYLIADLLNVSRLQTGKFVIENRPTNIADLVEGEVDQLKEQAAARKIALAYQKPAAFPTLNLDDTKVRQVIMNFLDNAIYYTPSGGSVTVAVEATADSVSYTVTDTGVGVPPSVQHHLFSKFYRAENAKKMRPDGTGLGLFMAKKVIVAQGGALIFKSTEGKGSTFGFSFPRKSMEVKAGDAPKTDVADKKDLMATPVSGSTDTPEKTPDTAKVEVPAKEAEASLTVKP